MAQPQLQDLLEALPRANPDLVSGILDWRNTNSAGVFRCEVERAIMSSRVWTKRVLRRRFRLS